MTYQKHRRSRWAGFGAAMLLCAPLFAIDRDLKIEQLYHTSWTHNDGVPSQIQALAQTTDGFLWIGTATGLYWFDGIHFEPYEPSAGEVLPKTTVNCLLAVPEGGLWVGFRYGPIVFLKDGKVTSYVDSDTTTRLVFSLARDPSGVVWASRPNASLQRLVGDRWETVGPEWGVSGIAYYFYADHAGTLWLQTAQGTVYLPKGGRKFQKPAELAFGYAPFAESPDGTVWMLDYHPPNGSRDLRRVGPGPGVPSSIVRKFDRSVRINSLLADERGSLWVGTAGRGISRIQYPERMDAKNLNEEEETTDTFRQKDGLSGDVVRVLLEDREGDVWAATNGGLDRFRQTAHPREVPFGIRKFHSFSTRQRRYLDRFRIGE